MSKTFGFLLSLREGKGNYLVIIYFLKITKNQKDICLEKFSSWHIILLFIV